ncbi:methyltransferase domain-containing protein [Shewanella schlegeliana]|uniref:class I SAM-dependent methyltransferase n=1 Tax=Shewanella schlegeliana TaxID=190308 RepID=UPI001FD0DC2B|nr:methyltransferase domain-containing protein [Shewanella schlegeliana]MCL1108062.1 methyltransferase domain-containing protein [Shewanella schlegeliana]
MEEKKLKANTAALITQFSALNDYLAPSCQVLDLACGSGRNGQWFTNKGCHVSYLDQNLSRLDVTANDPSPIELLEWDLEDGSAPKLPTEHYDIVLVFNYLHRPLFAQIMDSIKPGGIIIYETFTEQQAQIGRPKNPNFLLKTGELKALFANWHTLHYAEDLFTELSTASYKAQLIAQKPPV